jgi:hypothetical protein
MQGRPLTPWRAIAFATLPQQTFVDASLSPSDEPSSLRLFATSSSTFVDAAWKQRHLRCRSPAILASSGPFVKAVYTSNDCPKPVSAAIFSGPSVEVELHLQRAVLMPLLQPILGPLHRWVDVQWSIWCRQYYLQLSSSKLASEPSVEAQRGSDNKPSSTVARSKSGRLPTMRDAAEIGPTTVGGGHVKGNGTHHADPQSLERVCAGNGFASPGSPSCSASHAQVPLDLEAIQGIATSYLVEHQGMNKKYSSLPNWPRVLLRTTFEIVINLAVSDATDYRMTQRLLQLPRCLLQDGRVTSFLQLIRDYT